MVMLEFETIKKFLLSSFEMKEMGEAEMILGTRIKPKDNVIYFIDWHIVNVLWILGIIMYLVKGIQFSELENSKGIVLV